MKDEIAVPLSYEATVYGELSRTCKYLIVFCFPYYKKH